MKRLLLFFAYFVSAVQLQAQNPEISLKFKDAIPVLNLGTFHMGYSPDATTTEFDEHDQGNVAQVHRIAQAIADFKPTVILVETEPFENEALWESFQAYLENPSMKFDNPSEIQLLAFEVGRLANTSRIYGIDYQEGYNYSIGYQLENSMDKDTYFRYMKLLNELEKQFPEEEMTVLEHLKMTNDPRYQDILMNINADILTHTATAGNSEGADEATKFYHRNLVMYSNLNQIELDKEDRVFILMGGTHTAFFNMWLERSPKYLLAPVEDYLNAVKN
ncbi:DUF5694 domain-containing protein [Algoriphagus resistens]|uniref:DUF5694 domain-containing protein n=1 Tax=Algoriphagus resistens TaxID=1750590 RepID=UPI000716A5C4|nr:DUF5694 domain-containing protein [Algoriphagus resistens]